jgi:hypothetical protein
MERTVRNSQGSLLKVLMILDRKKQNKNPQRREAKPLLVTPIYITAYENAFP